MRRAWVRLDNASNIFLAARSAADPKVFRLSAELDRTVDPRALQSAVEATFDRYQLFHAVLRRGVFWYYLQASDLRPRVTAEELPTCAPLYQADKRHLLFRVLHHDRRISLEVFHALADGTGALWFLSDVMTAYARLCTLDRRDDHDHGDGNRDAAHGPAGPDPTGRGGAARRGEEPVADPAAPVHGLTTDSFAHYFQRLRRTRPPAVDLDADFRRAAAAPVDGERAAGRPPSGGRPHHRASTRARQIRTGAYRVKGTRTPDDRTRAVELTVSARDVLALARAEGVSLTMYLTAAFFQAIRATSPRTGRNTTLAASVPVNLRQFFPSTSPRNFFATIRVEHTYGRGPDDLGTVCRLLDGQFRPRATPEALAEKLQKLVRFERMPLLRVVPRPVKDLILRVVNWGSNRGLSVAVSNLGRVTLPAPAEDAVRGMQFHVSAVRPQLCAISHAGLLTLTFTSPFTETDHIREFARLLTAGGVAVTVGAAPVTEAEIAELSS